MRRSRVLVICSVVGIMLFACGLPEPPQDHTATVIAEEVFATMTAWAAIPTSTSTTVPIPSPTPPATQAPTSSDYYPLAVGDYWVCTLIDGDGTVRGQIREEVIGTQEMEGVAVFVLRSWDL